MSLEERAKKFAEQAHAGQLRKYTGEPYIVHPAEVVQLLKIHCTNKASEEMLAAAWLHDVVEDTPVTIEQIHAQFGPKVAQLVRELTSVSKPSHGSRFVRKTIDRTHTAVACPQAKTIKLADVISNTASIADYDPEFAKIYMAEKQLLLEVLQQGDPGLFALARFILRRYYVRQQDQTQVLAA